MHSVCEKVLGGLCVILALSACSDDGPREALGMLERDRISLSATEAEIITALHVREGERVTKGQILLELDTVKRQASVAAMRADKEQANEKLRELMNGSRSEDIISAEARLAAAEATLVSAQKDYVRARDLVERDVGRQAVLDQALSARDAAQAAVQEATSTLTRLKTGERVEVIEQARQQVAAYAERLRLEEEKLADLTLVATRDGVVDALPWKLGERVKAGSPLVILQTTEAPYVRAYVPADKRVDIKVGDTLAVKIEGVEALYKGTVRMVRSDPAFTPYYALNQKDRSRLMYLTEVELGTDAKNLPTGLPAQVLLP